MTDESKVYFTKNFDENSITKITRRLLQDNPVIKGKTAVKVHFGEKGNTRFVSPEYIKIMIDELKNHTGELFLTDTNTLYRGMRLNATDHKKIAAEHGFGSINVPIIIADGELGDDDVKVPIDKPIFNNVEIGKAIVDSQSMFVVSHFKGHVLFGFGGALKNLGMGCGSRAAKLKMHSKVKPKVNQSQCTACGVCKDNCAFDAIQIDEKANINDNCIGCAKCISVCPTGAIKIPWTGNTSDEAQKRCSEHAFGAIKDRNCLYITFIKDITEDCDCAKDSEIIGEDIGIVASRDPVACDQAAYDLVKKHHGKDIFEDVIGVDGTEILKYSEEIGVGNRKYDLVEL